MKKLTVLLGIMILTTGAVTAVGGCGSNKDAAKALAAFQAASNKTMRQAIRELRAEAERRAEEMRERARLAAALGDVSLVHELRGTTIDFDECDTSNDGTTWTFDCDWTFSGDEIACDGTTYTFKSGKGSFDMTLTQLSSSKIKMAMNFDFDTKFKGGDLDDYVNLDCKFGIALTVNSSTGAVDADIDSCGNFSCEVDGSEIDCEDMQELMAETQC